MKTIFCLAAVAVLSFSVASAQSFVEPDSGIKPKSKVKPLKTILLYPEGQHVDKGIVEDGVNVTLGPGWDNGWRADKEIIEPNGNRKFVGDNARLDIYVPKKPNGKMVVVCPGGGYWTLSTFNEGAYAAEWLVNRGFSVCVVKYRIPRGHYEIPLRDVQNAFRYCRAHADEFGAKTIGVMGFSAGGHLAASVSTLFVDEVTRPDFSILYYPVTSMKEGLTHGGSRKNLIGNESQWLNKNMSVTKYEETKALLDSVVLRFETIKQITPQTPPTFIVHCSDDTTVPVENSLQYYDALQKNGVPVEMHIFPEGGHGFGFNAEKYVGEGKDRFKTTRPLLETLLENWLKALK